jgi:solute carrier family 13 (sodium-dependent dicarboxylate transporter), member 2/3/5
VGGITTLVGTATNLAFSAILSSVYPKYGSFNFFQWTLFTFPISITFIIIMYIIFIIMYTWNYKIKIENDFLIKKKKELGVYYKIIKNKEK